MCKVSSNGYVEFGYARISRKTQSIERQVRNILAAYPEAKIACEAFTGTKMEGRKEFDKILRAARSASAAGKPVRIIFDSVSRMSRNAAEGFETYKELYALGIELVFLKEGYINTSTYREAMERQLTPHIDSGDAATDELITSITEAINKYTLKLAEKQIYLAFQQAEKEVYDLHTRTAEGIETARLAGKQIGGVKGRILNVKKAKEAKEKILKNSVSFNGSLNDEDCMKLVGIARNTFYKYKRELREEREQVSK